VPKIFE